MATGKSGKRSRATMNVSLPRDLIDFVREKVDAGRYGSASEVVRDGLRRLVDEDAARAAEVAEIRRKVAEGFASVAAGQVLDGEEFVAALRQRLKARGKGRRRA